MKKQLTWLTIIATLIFIIIGTGVYITANLRTQFISDAFLDLKTEMKMAATQIQTIESLMEEKITEITQKIDGLNHEESETTDLLKRFYTRQPSIERIILKDDVQQIVDLNNRFSQNIYHFNNNINIMKQNLVQQTQVNTFSFEQSVRIAFMIPVLNPQKSLRNLVIIIDPEKIFKSVFSDLYISTDGHPWVLCHSGKAHFLLCKNCFEFSAPSTKILLSDFAIRESANAIVNGRLPHQKGRSAQKLLTSYIPITFFGADYMIGYIVSQRSIIGTLQKITYTFLGMFSLSILLITCVCYTLYHLKNMALSKEIALRESVETSRNEAIIANQTKTDFITNMSHEIRTPMNGIMGMNALLLDTRLDATQHQYAQTIKTSAHSLLAIINDILDFSNIETNQIHLEENAFNLRDTLEDFSDMMAARAFEKGLDYAAFVPYDIPSGYIGDVNRLRQILLNLVTNAVKYTDKGEIVVEVDQEEETETHSILKFTVSDTGLGIPRERMDRLFKPFSHVDMSLTRDYGGVGLGLIISKQLVEKMGGEIGMTSVERKGSKFWFTVQLKKDPRKRGQGVQISEKLSGLSVMIVENQLTCRKLLKHHLLQWNCSISEAEDGITALDKLRQADTEKRLPDLLIVNMHLPGMDGKTLSQAIRKDNALRSIPMVMLTSMLQHNDLQNYKSYGFSSFFRRPIKLKHMQQAILQAIATEEAQQTDTLKPRQSSITLKDRFKDLFVLIVEDNLVNQQVTENMIRKMGCRSKIAENGLEAIEMLKNIDFDLVLMDIQMPKMDGITTTKNIRDTESAVRKHDIPIIAMTAHALKGHKEKCFDAGMNDFLTKPLSIDLLANAIEKTGVKAISQQRTVELSKDQVLQKTTDSSKDQSSQRTDDPPKEQDQTPHSQNTPESTTVQVHDNACADSTEQPKQIDINIFDRESLLGRVGGNEDILQNIIQLFLKETPKQLSELEKKLASNEMNAATNIAHSIKGSTGNFGAVQMREISLSLEKMCREGHTEKANEIFVELKGSFETLKDYMC